MPLEVTGQLRPFSLDEIALMRIRTFGVRDRSHGVETRELGQNTLRKSWLVDWQYRHDFCELCCGNEVLWDDDGTTRLSRLLPDARYGRHPDFPELVATKVESIQGTGDAGIDEDFVFDSGGRPGVVFYPDAIVSVLYEHVPYNSQLTDAAVYGGAGEQSRYVYFDGADGDVEVYSMPGGGMHYIRADGVSLGNPEPHLRPLPFNFNWTRPIETFTYVHERLPFEAFDTSGTIFSRVYGTEGNEASFMGRVNQSPFMGRGTGTVLYLKCKPELLRAHTAAGKRWRLRHTFLFAPTGHIWLRYFDPKGTNTDFYMVGNGTAFHDSSTLPDNYSIVTGRADLNQLFEVG